MLYELWWTYGLRRNGEVVLGGVTWYGSRDKYGQFVIGMLGKGHDVCIYVVRSNGRFFLLTIDVVSNHASITFLCRCFEIDPARLIGYTR
jgi:hypothetical protein